MIKYIISMINRHFSCDDNRASRYRKVATDADMITINLNINIRTSSVWLHHGVLQIITVAFYRLV